jgi:hypothetical protein
LGHGDIARFWWTTEDLERRLGAERPCRRRWGQVGIVTGSRGEDLPEWREETIAGCTNVLIGGRLQ